MKHKNSLLQFPILCCIILSSCISTKKVDSIVVEKLGASIVEKTIPSTPRIKLVTDSLFTPEYISNTTKVKSYFIPAIFYWGVNHTLETEINNRFYINIFQSVLNHKQEVYQLDKLLDDRQLEIHLKELPNEFFYTYQTTYFFYLFGYFSYLNENIYTQEQKTVLTYLLKSDDGEVLKTATLVSNGNYMFSSPLLSSSRFITNHVINLENLYYSQCGELIEQIIKEL